MNFKLLCLDHCSITYYDLLLIGCLQDISEVASMQVHAIQAQQQSNDKELTSLRQQLIDIQAQSDEKTVIGLFAN